MREVEAALYEAVREPLHAALEARFAASKEDASLATRLSVMRTWPQRAFHVPTRLVQYDDWAPAVLELSEMAKARSPTEMLRSLLGSARAIFTSYYNDQRRRLEWSARITASVRRVSQPSVEEAARAARSQSVVLPVLRPSSGVTDIASPAIVASPRPRTTSHDAIGEPGDPRAPVRTLKV
jgi:hypothetical protein